MADSNIRKRGCVKAKLTIFSNFVDEVEKKAQTINGISEMEYVQLEERIARADQLIQEFDEIQSQIEDVAADIEDQFIQRAEFSTAFYDSISKAKYIIAKNANRATTTIPPSIVNDGDNHARQQCVNLPKIDLPKFSGSYNNWLEFRDTYESLIHDNSRISNIDKFHYLKAIVTGDAAQIIKSIDLSAANYSIAWEALNERYDNKRLLVQNHVKTLFNINTIDKESAHKLRKMVDDVLKNLRALNAMNQPTDYWDTLIIYLLTSKLDRITQKEWETHRSSSELPSLDDLLQFLKNRADILESIENNFQDKPKSKERPQTKALATHILQCPVCKDSHYIQNCKKYIDAPINQRYEMIKEAKLCTNCLRPGHLANTCRSGSCKKCRRKHNTTLHNEKKESSAFCNTEETDDTKVVAGPSKFAGYMHSETEILLSTAQIKIADVGGNIQCARALLDSGSQSSFISENLVKKLGFKTTNLNLTISSLNNTTSNIRSKCKLKVLSNNCNYSTNLQCLVVPKITGLLPNTFINKGTLNLPEDIDLADPTFHLPGTIDLLIGADCFWNLMCSKNKSLGPNQPFIQQTKLGWIISGPVRTVASKKLYYNHLTTHWDVQQQLSKFWEIEECNYNVRTLSEEEIACEKYFADNTRRSEEGRFIVAIPLKEGTDKLGESYEQAKKRFLCLERRLQNNKALFLMYRDFMREYENLGHMTKICNANNNPQGYFMPHHGVIREASRTTRLRVVFDGSAKTTSGLSFNDIQMNGPTIQDDLLSIIMRFRKHVYVMSADISKMYRQVAVRPEDQPFQQILWRETPTSCLNTYKLKTVTYGTRSASYLAIRSLQQLSEDCYTSHPTISRIIKRDFYVDDLLTGADSIDEAAAICKDIIDILKAGCFELRKFCSNEPQVLKFVPSDDNELNIINLGENENSKTLGLNWLPKNDELMYTIGKDNDVKRITKRHILSCVAQIFDPLGLLTPCMIQAKILMQDLWLEKLDWDEELPTKIQSYWMEFKHQLPILNDLRIPRRVVCNFPDELELHCFSDASEKAYGACVYIRSTNQQGEAQSTLLCSKSKVAPLKVISLPRLELCGALVAAKLAKKAIAAMEIKILKTVFWTDSTIVLGWLKMPPRILKTFVANRVSEIQQLASPHDWRHVPTKENPADLITRGASPNQILDLQLWWQGPQWLTKDEDEWPKRNQAEPVTKETPEIRKQKFSLATTINDSIKINNFSNLHKLIRIMAYIIRFKNKCLKIRNDAGSLTKHELDESMKALIRIAQSESFQTELADLKNKGQLSNKSSILSLKPLLDSENILRVGGRIINSEFSYDKKHPIILCSKHHLTKLIFIKYHKQLHHGGPQLLLAAIREEFWPIKAKNLAKKTFRQCITCFRYNARNYQPIMGHLPKERVQPGPPFNISGVDYAGPFLFKDRKGRGCKVEKCYISLFVCMVTKAVHLELVTSLTKEAFLMALRRFSSRRGKPFKIMSDNATNFVAANTELRQWSEFLKKNSDDIITTCADEGIEWEFIPPYAPHFGGLWEAGVKSVKHHLKRVMGETLLTFEEFYTLLVQVEAVLNSRPLTPLSSNPEDLNPLTPAHFIIGRSLLAIPEPIYAHIPINRLSFHQHLQHMLQDFWKRWSKEFISELQQRLKWKKTQGELKADTLVLVKDDHLPPTKWKMGRVLEFYQGRDKVGRVAKIRTQSGVITRAVNRICPLPLEDDPQHS